MATPYKFIDDQLCVKFNFLTTNSKEPRSLNLIAYRSLKHRCDSKNCTEIQYSAGSYSSQALVLFSSLEKSWREMLISTFGEPQKSVQVNWFESHYSPDRKAFDFYQAYTFDAGNRLALDLVEAYTLQASTIQTILKVKANRTAYARALGVKRLDIWSSLSRDVNNFRKVDHRLPTHKNSLRKKVKAFTDFGYEGLISKKLQNQNAKKITKKEQKAIIDELIAKHTNLDSEMIATIYNAIADQSGWSKITRQTISNRKKETNLITYAGRNGTKGLKNKMLMQHKRSTPDFPMLYWTLDGWVTELLYQDRVIDSKGNSKTTYHNRLTMVLVLDPFNKYPIGYAIGENESSELITKAIQNAINHTKELFGEFHKPYQIQSDNFAIKKLRPIYEAVSEVFTPAAVGNAKSKVIEPYFGKINKEYFRLYDNWSGFNIESGSKNQPNDEMLNKLRHSFPDKEGATNQIHRIIAAERSKKQDEFIKSFSLAPSEYINKMSLEQYLMVFGSKTARTIKMRPEGLAMQISGQKYFFDSFDLNFRNHIDKSWRVCYDESNMEQVLAMTDDGSLRFVLEKKYIEPMAIAERTSEDELKAKKIRDFNKSTLNKIVEARSENAEVVDQFFSKNPSLNDTLAKHLLTDSKGQHKQPEQELRGAIKKPLPAAQEQPPTQSSATSLESFHRNRTDLSKYL